MPGEKGFLSLLVVLLVAGTAAYFPYSAGSASIAARAAAVTAATQSSSTQATRRAPLGADDAELLASYGDPVSLIAEHFGKPIPIDEIWRADAHPGSVPDTPRASPYSRVYQSEYPHFVDRFQKLDLAPGTSSVEFLIATVPDPIDSNARWQFDPMYDSLQRAVSAKGYVLDRFYIPDWDPTRNPDMDQRPAGRLHERFPGVVLFRRQAAQRTDFLVLLLAFETATGGVHPIALRRAMWTAAEWSQQHTETTPPALGPPPDRCAGSTSIATIPIVGPTFSGSIPSIANAIDEIREKFPKCVSFSVVSGAATSAANKAVLITGRPNVSYSTTVLTDQKLLEALGSFLSDHVDRGRIAILVESNTAYGDALRAFLMGGGKDTPVLCKNGCAVLPFPLHISRLRSVVNAPNASSDPTAPIRRAVPLALDEPATAEDQVPSMAPRLTSSSTDVALSQILGTIEREDIAVIGLFATDTRDKLFLAQQITLQSPNALLFTIEGDLLFTHPDYLRYTRGMVVASSYPLFTGTQLWMQTGAAASARQQFVSTNAEGVYNATLALVDGGRTVPLLDYERSNGPSAWISAVGRNGLWPVRRSVVACEDCWHATPAPSLAGQSTDDRQQEDRPIHPSNSALVLFLGLQILAIAHVWIHGRRLLVERGSPLRRSAAFWGTIADAALLVAQYGVLVVLYGYVTALRPYHGPEVTEAIIRGSECVQSATLAFYALAMLAAVRWIRSSNVMTLLAAVSAAGLSFAAMAGVPAFARHLLTDQPLLLLNRGLQLFSGVSPIAPIVVVLGASYGWSLAQWARLSTPSLVKIPSAAHLDSLVVGGFARLATPAARSIDGAFPGGFMPWPLGIALAAAVALVGYRAFDQLAQVQTIESAGFDRFFLGGWVFLQCLVVLAFVSHWRLWRQTKQLFLGLSVHPIAGALKNVPRDLFANRLPPRGPRLVHLQHAVNAYEMMRARYETARAAQPKIDPEYAAVADATRYSANAIHTVPGTATSSPSNQQDPKDDARPKLAAGEMRGILETSVASDSTNDIAESGIWSATVREASRIVASPALKTYWHARGDSGDSIEAGAGKGGSEDSWQPAAEVFVAIPIALMARDLTSRVVQGMYLLFGCMSALVVYETSFRAYPRGVMLGVTWMYVAIGVATALATVVSAERDVVLSRLAGTQPGKIQWDAAFLTRTIIPLLFAVFTLLAMQFPATGSALLSWLKPMQTAIP